MWHMVGGEHSLKILAPQLLQFGIDSVLKILNESILNEWINLFRTPPGWAKQGWAGCIPIFWLIHIFLHIIGKENATFLGDSCSYSLTQ